jgi:hypothetical protein
LLAFWGDPLLSDGSLRYWESLIAAPEPVTSAVEDITGLPPRSFRERVADHAADFVPDTAAVPGRAPRGRLAVFVAAPALHRTVAA